jgi:acetyl esterase/lipase
MPFTKRAALATVSLAAALALAAPVGTAFAQGAQGAPGARQTTDPARTGGYVPLKDTLNVAQADMRRLLEKHGEIGARPIEYLSPEEARKVPTIADAVKALLRDQGKDPEALMAQTGVKKQDITYSGPTGDMPARVYTPPGQAPQGGWPVIVYFHGGGWVIADINTYEPSAVALAKKANAVVVSAEYRHGPENKFPAAHEDAVAAYSWVLRNAQSFGGDPTRVAVAGESAGGGLALHVAAASRDGNFQKPAHMLLVYPVAGTDLNTPSYQEHAIAKPLNKAMIQWFVQHYLNPQDLQSPMIDFIGKGNAKDLPSATIINAEIDPLESDGKLLADKLKAAGVEVNRQLYEGVAHEFFGADAVVSDAGRAQDYAAKELREALAAANRTGSTNRPRQ